jgi:hypothetical protein
MGSNKILLFLDSIGDKYYKIYLDKQNEVSFLYLDVFEEMEYDKNRFLSSLKFVSEQEAKLYLTENIEKLAHVSKRNSLNDMQEKTQLQYILD